MIGIAGYYRYLANELADLGLVPMARMTL